MVDRVWLGGWRSCAPKLLDIAAKLELPAFVEDQHFVDLATGRFDAVDQPSRAARWPDLERATHEIPGFFWAQLAYPPRAEWEEEIAAPAARIFAARRFGRVPNTCNYTSPTNPVTEHQGALVAAAALATPARIANNSWQGYDAVYNGLHAGFDRWVRDVDEDVENGEQSMAMVFAAGNILGSGTGSNPNIQGPAMAKNVITVGSTDSCHPFAPAAPSCFGWGNAPTDPPVLEPDNIHRISNFSRQGAFFAKAPSNPRAHQVRIKPDLMAPGWRVHSTAPGSAWYPTCGFLCATWDPAGTQYSFTRGTSFAAPAVSGAAAIARNWMSQNLGVADAKPSLVRAALIATADSLEGELPGTCRENDCRPSHRSGWGLVNLARLTGDASRFVINEATDLASGQGVAYMSLAVVDRSQPAFIVLAWTDRFEAGSPGLLNDLDLAVEEWATPNGYRWFGNVLRENASGIDDGWSQELLPSTKVGLRDAVNNVEVVFIPPSVWGGGSGPAGISVAVSARSTNGTPQDFAIYAYNVGPGGPIP